MIISTYDPDYWQLVPKEPTDAMLGAGLKHIEGMASLPSAWGDMLAVAPKHTPLENFRNPLTPYGQLVRVLRRMADVTLMDMSRATGKTPAQLSAIETGRKKVTKDDIIRAYSFFASKGIPIAPELLEYAADLKQVITADNAGQIIEALQAKTAPTNNRD